MFIKRCVCSPVYIILGGAAEHGKSPQCGSDLDVPNLAREVGGSREWTRLCHGSVGRCGCARCCLRALKRRAAGRREGGTGHIGSEVDGAAGISGDTRHAIGCSCRTSRGASPVVMDATPPSLCTRLAIKGACPERRALVECPPWRSNRGLAARSVLTRAAHDLPALR